MTKYVYDFAEGNKDLKDLLGGKGANLAEMTNSACRCRPASPSPPRPAGRTSRPAPQPDGLADEIDEHLAALEQAMGQRLGDPADPLLVSVRSGAKFSMPGMMETVLNVGLNDESVPGWPRRPAATTRFAWDSYRRLIQMFGKTVCDVPGEEFEDALRRGQGAPRAPRRPRPRRRRPARRWSTRTRRSSPSTPAATSRRTRASSSTWPSARSSTRGTPSGPCSTAARSASRPTSAPRSTWWRWSSATSAPTPAPASRSPATRPPARSGVYGDYLANAQGEDVVAGIRNTVPLQDLERLDKARYDELHAASWPRSRRTTATCATSSSPSSAASCGCCRPGSASAPPRPRSSSPRSSSTRA